MRPTCGYAPDRNRTFGIAPISWALPHTLCGRSWWITRGAAIAEASAALRVPLEHADGAANAAAAMIDLDDALTDLEKRGMNAKPA